MLDGFSNSPPRFGSQNSSISRDYHSPSYYNRPALLRHDSDELYEQIPNETPPRYFDGTRKTRQISTATRDNWLRSTSAIERGSPNYQQTQSKYEPFQKEFKSNIDSSPGNYSRNYSPPQVLTYDKEVSTLPTPKFSPSHAGLGEQPSRYNSKLNSGAASQMKADQYGSNQNRFTLMDTGSDDYQSLVVFDPTREKLPSEPQEKTVTFSNLENNPTSSDLFDSNDPYQQLKKEFKEKISLYSGKFSREKVKHYSNLFSQSSPKKSRQTECDDIQTVKKSYQPPTPERHNPQATIAQDNFQPKSQFARDLDRTVKKEPEFAKTIHAVPKENPAQSLRGDSEIPEKFYLIAEKDLDKFKGPYVLQTTLPNATQIRETVNLRSQLEEPNKYQSESNRSEKMGIPAEKPTKSRLSSFDYADPLRKLSERSLAEESGFFNSGRSRQTQPIPGIDQISSFRKDSFGSNKPSLQRNYQLSETSVLLPNNAVYLSLASIGEDKRELDLDSSIVNTPYLADEKSWNNEGIDLADMLESEGLRWFERNEFAKALEAFNKSLAISQNHFGRNHPRISGLLHKIGYVLATVGKLASALSCYNESLVIAKKHFGENDLTVAELLQNIGNIYYQREYPKRAKEYYCQSLDIKIKNFGESHPEIAELMINVANVLKTEGRIDEALIIYERGLEILQKNTNSSEDMGNLSVAMNNLAVIYMENKRYGEALSYFENCLQLKKKIHGDSHPEIGDVLTNIGNVYFQIGNHEGALENYKKSLEVKRKFYDESHKDIIMTLANINLVQDML